MTTIVINKNHRPRAILRWREFEQGSDSYAMSADLVILNGLTMEMYVKRGLASQ
jgi:hypothetical protein